MREIITNSKQILSHMIAPKIKNVRICLICILYNQYEWITNVMLSCLYSYLRVNFSYISTYSSGCFLNKANALKQCRVQLSPQKEDTSYPTSTCSTGLLQWCPCTNCAREIKSITIIDMPTQSQWKVAILLFLCIFLHFYYLCSYCALFPLFPLWVQSAIKSRLEIFIIIIKMWFRPICVVMFPTGP